MHNQRKLLSTTISILGLSLFLTASIGLPVLAQGNTESLYHRLKGYDAIAAVAEDFIGRLASDPRFEKFFAGFSVDSKKRLRQHLVDQLCAAAGGPCIYTGRDMKTTHTGLGITEDDWNAAARHLVESLDKYKVAKKEKDDVLAFVTTLKKDIVEK